jgi:tRNA threonylcarbamoyladenosine biosynthesis protein TsaE
MSPILGENVLEFVSHGATQTRRLGARLGALLRGGDTLCLEGELGSGKTCLAQGVGRGWGVIQTLISPSYVLIREYARPSDDLVLFHIDLYRVGSVGEAADLGLDEILATSDAVAVVEWADRARALMPANHLWIRLEHIDATRRGLRFEAQGERHMSLLRDFRREAFGV